MTGRADMIQALAAATSTRQVAVVLLTLPDAEILGAAELLRRACERHGFAEGADFVEARRAVLIAGRDLSGLLPPELAVDLEHFRAAMARYAAGGM